MTGYTHIIYTETPRVTKNYPQDILEQSHQNEFWHSTAY